MEASCVKLIVSLKPRPHWRL